MPQAKMKARPLPPHISAKDTGATHATGDLESLSVPKRDITPSARPQPAKLQAAKRPSRD